MSISENLYNLGALMKTNLEKKGITGLTGNEGLTTLANKILDIECNDSPKNVVANITGDSISLGINNTTWIISAEDVVIDWGDGTSDTVNNPSTKLSHTYTDGLNEHSIVFNGTITSLGNKCFYSCSGLTSIVIPNGVTSLGNMCFERCSNLISVTIPDSITNFGIGCFWECSSLTSIVIPNNVTNIGGDCFYKCSSLINYELYWETQPIPYDSTKMPVNTGTVFTIPTGTTSVYTDAGYPVARLVERGSHNYQLSVVSDKDIISNTEVATLTATLSDNSTPVSGETLNYQIKHGSTVIDSGTKTTDSNGEATITYNGSGVGDVDIVVSYGTLLQETYELEDYQFYDSLTSNSGHWSIPSDVTYGYNEYSSDGWKLGNASKFCSIPSDFHVTFPFKLSFVLKDRYSYTPQVNFGEKYIEFDYNKIEIQGTRLTHSPINGAEYSFIVRSDSVEAYCNNNLVGSVNVSFAPTDTNLRLATGGNRYFQIKDLKVKAL